MKFLTVALMLFSFTGNAEAQGESYEKLAIEAYTKNVVFAGNVKFLSDVSAAFVNQYCGIGVLGQTAQHTCTFNLLVSQRILTGGVQQNNVVKLPVEKVSAVLVTLTEANGAIQSTQVKILDEAAQSAILQAVK